MMMTGAFSSFAMGKCRALLRAALQVRLEIGAGPFAGSTLLVHAEGGRVRVHVDVPAGVDASGLHGRIAERLHARGIGADAVEVT